MLSGGESFSKSDLSQAYNQVLLDEDSKQYTFINTHKGLFHYIRLPFGINSAPGIFQIVMEGLLQGMDGVIVYIDDILVSERSILRRWMRCWLDWEKLVFTLIRTNA